MASNFTPLNKHEQLAMAKDVQQSLTGLTAPWDVPGYEDGQLV